jgi:hypothetical protein
VAENVCLLVVRLRRPDTLRRRRRVLAMPTLQKDHTMIIHNGDHLQYEIDNANTPLRERSDWPLPSFDA